MVSFRKTFLVVDYDASRVRVAEVAAQRSGAVKVLRQLHESLPDGVAVGDPDAFGTFLARWLEREGVTTRWAVLAVGRDAAMLHHLTVPATAADELANLVRFRMSQELPFAIEESVVDYVITERDSDRQVTNVLAGAVRLEHLDYLRHLARAAGLRIKRIGLRPYASFLACRAAGYLADGPALFVELGRDVAEIGAFTERVSLFSRSVGVAGEDDQALIDNTLLQLQRTLPAYTASERYEAPAQVIVAGDTGLEDDFLGPAAEQLALKARRFEVPASQAGGVEYASSACYGLATGQVCEKNDRFDFVDPKRAVDPTAKRTRTVQIAAAVLIGLLILAIVGSKRVQSTRQATLAELRGLDKKMKTELREFQDFTQQVTRVNQWRGKKVDWLGELQQLTDRLPDPRDVYADRMRFAESRKDGILATIEINGNAKSGEIVNRLFEQLNQDGRYSVSRGGENVSPNREYPENFKFTVVIGKAP